MEKGSRVATVRGSEKSEGAWQLSTAQGWQQEEGGERVEEGVGLLGQGWIGRSTAGGPIEGGGEVRVGEERGARKMGMAAGGVREEGGRSLARGGGKGVATGSRGSGCCSRPRGGEGVEEVATWGPIGVQQRRHGQLGVCWSWSRGSRGGC